MPARFRMWDDGGRTSGRYTIVDSRPCTCPDMSGHYRGRTRDGVTFSETPYYAQGVGLSFELDAVDWAAAGRRQFRSWGRRIKFAALPNDGKALVADFLLEAEATDAQARTLGTTLAECRTWLAWLGGGRPRGWSPPKGEKA